MACRRYRTASAGWPSSSAHDAAHETAFDATLAHDVATRERLEVALAFRAEVAATPPFRELGPAEHDLLLTRFVPRVVGTGESTVRQGEPGDSCYVVRAVGSAGCVRSRWTSPSHGRVVRRRARNANQGV